MQVVALGWFVFQISNTPIALGLLGLALVIFALTPSFAIASLILVACGAGATMTMTVANTLLQTQAPTGMRGRVMSLYTLIAAGLTPLGALVVTSLGKWTGLAGATIVAGLGVATAVIAGYRVLRTRLP